MESAAQEYVSLANGNHLYRRKEQYIYEQYMYGKSFIKFLCVPDLDHNWLSMSCLENEGYKEIFANGTCKVIKNNRLCA